MNVHNIKDEDAEIEKDRAKYERDKTRHLKSLKIVVMEGFSILCAKKPGV